MSYAIYNIGTKILHIKPGLYSNSQPHRPNPNPLWSKILSLFTKISISPQEVDNLTFKSLYQTLLQPDPNPIPLQNTTILHTWLRLTLAKPRLSGQPIKAIPGDVSFPNIISNPETPMTSFAKSVSLLLMILTIFSSPAPSPEI